MQIIFNYFDREDQQQLNYDEFFKVIRGRMPEFREAMVERSFEDISAQCTGGVIELEDIRVRFNAENHPDSDSGRKNQDQVTNEFLDSFESHHALWVNFHFPHDFLTLPCQFTPL